MKKIQKESMVEIDTIICQKKKNRLKEYQKMIVKPKN